MRAVRGDGRGGVGVVELPAPAGDDGVRVRIASAGICGSDLHLLDAGLAAGHTLGHEMAGLLEDDTPVAIEPIAGCGGCERCVEGHYNLCAEVQASILGIARDGGMADEIRVPPSALVRLPAGLRAADACLVEPVAVAVHGLRRGGVRGGERIAVVGGGALGLATVAAAREAGRELGLAARHDAQRIAGERLGAGPVGEDPVYDVVVDAAGTESSLAQAVSLCRPGGTLILVATYWEGLSLPGFALCLKEVRVVPASLYGRSGTARDVDAAAALLARAPEVAATLISHRLPLDAAAEAFAVARDRAAGAIKVVLEP